MKKQILLAIGVGTLAVTSIAMALGNDNKTLTRVDTQSDKLILHFSTPHSTAMPSACNAHNNIMACDLSDSYCDMAGKIALAAHMAGRTVDYDLSSSECLGTFAKFNRFRVNAN